MSQSDLCHPCVLLLAPDEYQPEIRWNDNKGISSVVRDTYQMAASSMNTRKVSSDFEPALFCGLEADCVSIHDLQ